jgi:hypothetical protein
LASNPEELGRYVAAQQAVTRALVETEDVDEAFRRVLRKAARELGWDVAVAWRATDPGELEPFARCVAPPDATARTSP